jgi:hypothetical protein
VQAAMAGRISVEEPSIIMKHRDDFPSIKERRMSLGESMTGSFNQTATEHTRTKAYRITKPDDHGNISSLLDETTISSKCKMPIFSMECPVSQTSGTGNPVFSQVEMRENSSRPLQRSWPSQKLLHPMSTQHGLVSILGPENALNFLEPKKLPPFSKASTCKCENAQR